jgi:hypothetical protein
MLRELPLRERLWIEVPAMLNQRIWTCALPVLLLTGGCGDSLGPDEIEDGNEDDDCTLAAFPSASITLDAQVGDWSGVEPFASDPRGDDSPDFTGDDIRALYVGQASGDLFVRIDLWEDVNTNFGNGPPDEEYGRYEIDILVAGAPDDMSIGIAYDKDRGEWSVGHNGANSGLTPAALVGPTFAAVAGSVIEFRAPFTLVGDPSLFSELWAKSLTTDALELDVVGKVCTSG